jgi:hypothetical protein
LRSSARCPSSSSVSRRRSRYVEHAGGGP